jgi:hypothetical protein
MPCMTDGAVAYCKQSCRSLARHSVMMLPSFVSKPLQQCNSILSGIGTPLTGDDLRGTDLSRSRRGRQSRIIMSLVSHEGATCTARCWGRSCLELAREYSTESQCVYDTKQPTAPRNESLEQIASQSQQGSDMLHVLGSVRTSSDVRSSRRNEGAGTSSPSVYHHR